MKRVLSLVFSAAILLAALSVLLPYPVQANPIPVSQRAIFFPAILSTSPGAPFTVGANHTDSYLDIDLLEEGLYTISLPPWPRSDTAWAVNSCKVILLYPDVPHANALPVRLESIMVNGEQRFGPKAFSRGGFFWNQTAGPYFGDVSPSVNLPGAISVGTPGWNPSQKCPGFDTREARIPVDAVFPIDEWNSAGPSEALGTINAGDIMTITVRVGTAPPIRYGHVMGKDYISADDLTMLRRYVAAPDKRAFLDANPGFNPANADVNGDKRINRHDVAMLARYIANDKAWIGPPPPLVAITFDDGPYGGFPSGQTMAIANHMRDAGIKYGVNVRATFFCNTTNNNNNDGTSGPNIIRELIRRGHEIANHTDSHFGAGPHAAPVTNRAAYKASIERATATLQSWANGATDPDGVTYSASNPYPIRWFRPPFFAHGPALIGIDKELDMPWFWSDLDSGDAGGNQTAAGIIDLMLGNAMDRGLDGVNVLFHDGGTLKSWTVNAMRGFLDPMIEMGYEFVTVGDMVDRNGYTPKWYEGAPVNGSMRRAVLPD
jgi:peptidoglycan/xylan/chitin deacetylase (PgdA/CDA1 family)